MCSKRERYVARELKQQPHFLLVEGADLCGV